MIALLERFGTVADDGMPAGEFDDPADGHGKSVDEDQHAIIGRTERPRGDDHVGEADDPGPRLAAHQPREVGEDLADRLGRGAAHAASPAIRAMAAAARSEDGWSVRSKLCAKSCC